MRNNYSIRFSQPRDRTRPSDPLMGTDTTVPLLEWPIELAPVEAICVAQNMLEGSSVEIKHGDEARVTLNFLWDEFEGEWVQEGKFAERQFDRIQRHQTDPQQYRRNR